MIKTSGVIGLAGLALMLGACGQQDEGEWAETAVSAGSTSGEQLVIRRAEDRWQSLIAWDVEKAYGYLSPGTREGISLPAYSKKKAMGPAQFKDAVVKSTQCEERVCTLKVELTYIYQGSVVAMQGRELSSIVTEKWIATDDNWFHVPD